MNKDSKQSSDMSIEEILKSIKTVINDRQKTKVSNNDDILELTEVADNHRLDVDQSEVKDESLISTEPAIETKDILKNFTDAIKDIDFNEGNMQKSALEDVVIEILKPELKRWLNENLPSLVRQLVERELQKLVPNNKK